MTTRTKADRARKRTITTADQVRNLHAIGWSPSAIVDQIGVSRQAVYAAIKRGGARKPGRPRTRKVICRHCGKEAT